jgi:hypothetical protein
VRLARHHVEAEPLDRRRQPRALGEQAFARISHVARLTDRGLDRSLRRRADHPGRSPRDQLANQSGRRERIADAQTRERMVLRQRAHEHDVVAEAQLGLRVQRGE